MLKRFHSKLKRPMVVIQPGEYYVTGKDEIIATVLGSCISVCLKDETNGIGGMNHFMLPGDFRSADVFDSQSARYGMYAMELVIGDIIKMGGGRGDLTAKVFGGGHVLASLSNTGQAVPRANIDFVKSFLSMEGIRIINSDVGGQCGRKVLYMPAQGKAFIKRLAPLAGEKLARREQNYKNALERDASGEDLTLF
jgi:chemotaxis protein CheD